MFRIGLVQNDPKFLRVEENLERCLGVMERRSADFWVLPEFFATGYNFKNAREVHACAQAADGPFTRRLWSWAADHDCAIAAGFVEKAGGRLYNSAALVHKGGARVYRKTHLYGREKEFFSPGDSGFWVEKVKGVSVGLMICFDWFFPEACRTLALAGAEIVAHCANLVLPWGPEGMKIRSLENRVFSATANRVGEERGLRYIGCSQVVAPNGKLLRRLSGTQAQTAVVSVNPALARDKSLNRRNDLFTDRRPEFYKMRP
ncbi:MAG: nitrilase-related carbon-nitrogen hydrolase [Elusimicrobiota bacterium]